MLICVYRQDLWQDVDHKGYAASMYVVFTAIIGRLLLTCSVSAMQLLEDSNDKNAMQLLKDCVSKVV